MLWTFRSISVKLSSPVIDQQGLCCHRHWPCDTSDSACQNDSACPCKSCLILFSLNYASMVALNVQEKLMVKKDSHVHDPTWKFLILTTRLHWPPSAPTNQKSLCDLKELTDTMRSLRKRVAHLLGGFNRQLGLTHVIHWDLRCPQQTETLILLWCTVISQSLVMCLNSCILPRL